MLHISRDGQAEILNGGFVENGLEVLLILDRHGFWLGFAFKDIGRHGACDLAEFVVINRDSGRCSAFHFTAFPGKDWQFGFFGDFD